jgi:hypothetical protein
MTISYTLAALLAVLALSCTIDMALSRVSNLGVENNELDPVTAAAVMEALNSDELQLQQLYRPVTLGSKGATGYISDSTGAASGRTSKGRRAWRRTKAVPRPNNSFAFNTMSRNTRADGGAGPGALAAGIPPPAVAAPNPVEGAVAAGAPHQWLELETKPPLRISARLHGEVTLECEAVGSPPPLIYWLKNGTPIDALPSFDSEEMVNGLDTRDTLLERRSKGNFIPSSFAMSKIKSKLPLRCIRPEEEAVYTCVADNFGHQLKAETTVVIEEDDPSESWRPECEFRLPTSYVQHKKLTRKGTKAYVHVAESLHMEAIGKDIILPCRGGGKPKPRISWTGADGQSVVSGKKFQLNTKGDLIIKNLSWSEMGEYSCLVENQFGYEVASTFLYPLLNDAEESAAHTHANPSLVQQQQR